MQIKQSETPPTQTGRIIALVIILFVAGIITVLAVNIQNGEIVKSLTAIGKSFYSFNEQPSTNTSDPYFSPHEFPILTIATPSATPKPTTSNYYNKTYYPTSKPFPTYVFPTVVPGQPGSKEWEEQFQKQWDEMTKKNAEMQKQVEDSQKAFCSQHPDLCNK